MLIEMPAGDYRRAGDVRRASLRQSTAGFVLRVELDDGTVDDSSVGSEGTTAQERLDEFAAAVNEALSASRARP